MRYVGAVVGTRPEAIKLAPVVHALQATAGVKVRVIATGQHRDMLSQMFPRLGLEADVDLNLMRERQSLTELTAAALRAIGGALQAERYDALVVQGDTTTAMCGALSAFYAGVPVAHVEAGLRSGLTRSPFPEEANRRIIGDVARWHFCPTHTAAATLDGAPEPKRVLVTGNTSIDTLMWAKERLSLLEVRDPRRPVGRLFITMHRRESQGERQWALCQMIRRLLEEYRLTATLPVHPNPDVAEVIHEAFRGCERVALVAPLDYFDCLREMSRSDLILTDSGGIQEEAPSLGVPVIVLREATERTEAVAAGCALLAGNEVAGAEPVIRRVLEDPELRGEMSAAENPYGDGRAAERIAHALVSDLLKEDRPAEVSRAAETLPPVRVEREPTALVPA